MSKPVIGISGSIIIDQGGQFAGYHRSYVNDDYIDAVIKAGGIPYIIPLNTDLAVIEEQIANVDALILSGGHDLNPYLYGQEPSQKLTDIFSDRDTFDFALLKAAEAKKIPILGICRGFHVINVYHGGDLYQDLSYADRELQQHWQKAGNQEKAHTVELVKNEFLNDLFAADEVMVNSFHHQCVKNLAPQLTMTAQSKDGVCEGYINKEYSNLEIGVQWHPEMLHNFDAQMQKLFNVIVEKAQKGCD